MLPFTKQTQSLTFKPNHAKHTPTTGNIIYDLVMWYLIVRKKIDINFLTLQVYGQDFSVEFSNLFSYLYIYTLFIRLFYETLSSITL